MGCMINAPSATSAQDEAVKRESAKQNEARHLQFVSARSDEDRSIKEMGRPPGMSESFYNDLWSLTAPSATNEGHLPHPEMPGATSAQLHASPGLELKDREWAAQQNALQDAGRTPEYHAEAPVVIYRVNLTPTEFERVHGADNQEGRYATRPVDINDGHMSAEEIARRLSLPTDQPLPTKVSDVHVAHGTFIEASRPDSGEARQFKISDIGSVSFVNTRDIG